MYKDCYRSYDDLRAFFLGFACSDYEPLRSGAARDGMAEELAKWLVDNGYEISRYEMDDDYIDGLRKELREDAESGFAGDERLTEKQAEDWEWQTRTDPDWRKGEVVGLNIKDLIMPPVRKSLADGMAEKGGRGFDELDRCPEDILKEEIEK